MRMKNKKHLIKKYKRSRQKYLQQYLKQILLHENTFLSPNEAKRISQLLITIPSNYLDKPEDEYNYCQLHINFGSLDYNIGVDIRKTKTQVKQDNLEIHTKALDDFIPPINTQNFKRYKDLVFYSNVSDKESSKSIGPIILLYSPLGIYAVLDGNHRVHEAIKSKEKEIKYYCIDFKYLLDHNLLVTDFDKNLLECLKIYFSSAKRAGIFIF